MAEKLGAFPAPPALISEDPRRRLFDCIAGLVAGLSRQTCLVLLLDDLQWTPGISLLAHVARRFGESRALILGAYREQEFQEEPALVREWAELNRTWLATQLRLTPLTEEHTEEFLAHYFGEGPAAQLRRPVYRRTQGNAFFVEEVLRTLTESGAVRATPIGWEVTDATQVTIPESIRLAVEERVSRLGEAAREVLTQAAVLGQEFGFPTLVALTDRSEEEVLDVIDRAIVARLLVDRSRAGEERYGFLDDLLRRWGAAAHAGGRSSGSASRRGKWRPALRLPRSGLADVGPEPTEAA